jgi:hypothetical protein
LLARNDVIYIGYFCNDSMIPISLLESWSDIEVPADTVSERVLTITAMSNFDTPMGAGVPIKLKGFRCGCPLVMPTEYFDGQAITDVAYAKSVLFVTAQDRGAASNMVDGILSTKWAFTPPGPGSATIDLGNDYSIDYLYYNAYGVQQKFLIEFLNSVSTLLYQIDETAAFTDDKKLYTLDKNPPITTVRFIRITITETQSPIEAKCNVLQALVNDPSYTDGKFYVPGYEGLSLKDTSIYPYEIHVTTDVNGQVVFVYRAGSKGGCEVQNASIIIE